MLKRAAILFSATAVAGVVALASLPPTGKWQKPSHARRVTGVNRLHTFTFSLPATNAWEVNKGQR